MPSSLGHVAPAPGLLASTTALPAYRYTQLDLAELAQTLLPEHAIEANVLSRFFRNVGVQQRFLALPKHEYAGLTGLAARNRAYVSAALELGERALTDALRTAELPASEVDLLVTTTVTGLAVPSLDARLMNRIPFADDLKRMPLFGLGCLGGVAGLARTAEYLRAFPKAAAAFLSVELCSLTLQKDDASVANVIASGLFGDGAAALVLVGAEHPRAHAAGPSVLDSKAKFFHDTERVMGWDVVDGGFKIVLGSEVPSIAREGVPGLVDALLQKHGKSRNDVDYWIVHPGGPAVMEGLRAGLGLTHAQVERTKRSLSEVGNLSSASVLFLLDEVVHQVKPEPGRLGLMIAMGPAFCAEAVLLQW